MSDIKEKQVLLGLSKEEISSLLPDCPKYTAAQIYSFLQDGKNFDEMTSLKKRLAREAQKQLYRKSRRYFGSVYGQIRHEKISV